MTTPMDIRLHTLQEITNGFSDDLIIGSGGYGNVYKAVYNEELIAVKLLHPVSGLDDELFNNEVGNLLSAQHPNIVRLRAYCHETHSKYVVHNGKNRLCKHIYRVLCFEYLEGGSLDKQLRDQTFCPEWSTRYSIIKGICEGLNFLHNVCEPPIFHLDLKPANILLDRSMVPKVADFGLSRLFGGSHSHATNKAIGTEMYMPPELIHHGIISCKNDVFSLGVVIKEIVRGTIGNCNSEMVDSTQVMDEVRTNWKNIIEATPEYASEEINQVQTCIDIAATCMEPDRENRPTIADILSILNKTETHIPNRQLPNVLPSSTIGLENTMVNEVKKSREELYNITNQNPCFNSMLDNISSAQQGLRVTTSDLDVSLIIGRAEEKQKIVATLCGIRGRFYHELSLLYTKFVSIFPKMVNWGFGPRPRAETRVAQGVGPPLPDITILPIYGIGGIGKTTLAQLVFNDSQFVGYSRVWVYVSQNFDLDKIGNSIISQLSKVSHVTEKQVIYNHLRKLLAGKKILIVLDDLWEKNPGRIRNLKTMLRLGAGSMVKIIVTTRDEAVAKEICHTVEPYKLETLTNKICWAIIKQKTGFKDRADKEQLKHIGREIATKCGGVALAAQSLGYTLNGKTSDEWESVRDNYMWNLSTSEDPSSIYQEVLPSLLLSYSHMPDWLKLCFSYCAVFSKGHLLAKYDLIHQWIALGFIEQSSTFDSMQLCEKYVTQLLGMSFLQYSKIPSTDGRHGKDATLLTMHDLVHDLARAILADQVTDKGNAGGNRCSYALLTDCTKPLQLSVTFPANIRALCFLDCHKLELRGDAFSLATCLRVLDLSECLIQWLPDSIGRLKQLRFLCAPRIQDQMIPDCITELSELNYLSLRESPNISALPESIGDMKGLMHLDLSRCSEILELPISSAKLKQLVHLDLSHCYVSESISEVLGGFTKLQHLNLSHIYLSLSHMISWLTEVIGYLNKLRYLNLSGNLNKRKLNGLWAGMAPSTDQIQSLLDSISTLSNLEHLNLSFNEDISSIPESMGNLRKLHTLDLSKCSLLKLPDSMVNMVSLKVLNVDEHVTLDESVLSLLNILSLPHFVVLSSSTDKCSSNIILLQPTDPDKLMIDRLENVKSVEEVQSIKLIEKQNVEILSFRWAVAAERFVDDTEVLGKLVPPSSVKKLSIDGYRSESIPDWFMDIRLYLPYLLEIHLYDFPKCKNLPPLGQLKKLTLWRMEGLEEWSTVYTGGKEGVNELMFPEVETLSIIECPKLRIKPCLPKAKSLYIECSDNVLSSFRENSLLSRREQALPFSKKRREQAELPSIHDSKLEVEDSKVPLHQWRLLYQLPALRSLTIKRCSDLTSSAEIIQRLSSLQSLSLVYQAKLPRWVVKLTSLQELNLWNCSSMTSLPQWLGELASLKKLDICCCEGIRSLPDSIQQLTKLEVLYIQNCPTLMKWCQSEENKMKLDHIIEKRIWD